MCVSDVAVKTGDFVCGEVREMSRLNSTCRFDEFAITDVLPQKKSDVSENGLVGLLFHSNLYFRY